MNIRDQRSVAEQIRSGFRLTVFILLTFFIVGLLLISTGYVLAQARGVGYRAGGMCGLAILFVFLWATTRYWAKWFFGFLGYSILKLSGFLLLGLFAPSHSGIHPLRWIIEGLVLLMLVSGLLMACLIRRQPSGIESVGLTAVVVSLSFWMVTQSNLPLLIGTSALAVAELITWFVLRLDSNRNHRPFATGIL